MTTLYETTVTFADTVFEDTDFTTLPTFLTTTSTTAKTIPTTNISRTSQTEVKTTPTTGTEVTEITEGIEPKHIDTSSSTSSTSKIFKTDSIWLNKSEEQSPTSLENSTEVMDDHSVLLTVTPSATPEETTIIDELFYTVPEEFTTNSTAPKLATFDTTSYETSPLDNDIYTTAGYAEKVTTISDTTFEETTETWLDVARTTDVIWSEDEWNVTKFITDTTQIPFQCLNTTCKNEGKCYITGDGPKVSSSAHFSSINPIKLIDVGIVH